MDLRSIGDATELSRRGFLAGAGAFAATLVSGCTTTGPGGTIASRGDPAFAGMPSSRGGFGVGPGDYALYSQMYAAVSDGGFNLPAMPYDKIDRKFLRQVVSDPTGEKPGTVVVDTRNHFLYLVGRNGEALRYGVGLGRAGFEWSGKAVIQWKRAWPRWTPPEEMIVRDPKLRKYSAENGGMEPGLDNPLGARALYIFQDGVDTLYRLHGSPEWQSIGRSVSSGCVRLINQDVMDLFERVPNRTPIIVA